MKWVIGWLLAALVFFSIQAASASDMRYLYPTSETPGSNITQGTFTVNVVPFNTSLGSAIVNDADTRAIIGRVASNYSALSGGKIKIQFGKILPRITLQAKKGIDVAGVQGAEDALDLVPHIYAANVIIVAVIPWYAAYDHIGGGGQGGVSLFGDPISKKLVDRRVVIIKSGWDNPVQASHTLMHEIGHTFGLGHTGMAVCPLDGTHSLCTSVDAYTPGLDFMGMDGFGAASMDSPMRLSARQLDNLGLLSDSEKIYLYTSTTITLAPVYSEQIVGPRIAFIPVYDSLGYSLEYRPRVSSEFGSGMNNLGYLTHDIGVDIYSDVMPIENPHPLLPQANLALMADGNLGDAMSAARIYNLVGNLENPIGPQIGVPETLPNGTTITVLSADPLLGAQVRIDMPQDVIPPKSGAAVFGWNLPKNVFDCSYGSSWIKPPYSIYTQNPRNDTIGLLICPTDDRKIQRVDLEVNRSVVSTFKMPSPPRYINVPQALHQVWVARFAYHPLHKGSFKIRAIIYDEAGNSTSKTFPTLTLS